MIKVARGLDPRRFESQILCLSRDHTLARSVRDAGIPLTTLDTHPLRSVGVGPFRGAIRFLRRERPDLVQTWLLDADLIGGLAARRVGIPVIWNIRASLADSGWKPFASSARLRAVAHICEAMSGVVPCAIVSCSAANVERNMRRYRHDKIRVIPNGVDVEVFKPDPIARAEIRAQLEVADATPLIGMVARFHPVKDFTTFFAAARQLIATHPHARFVLCGQGTEQENVSLTRLIRSHGLELALFRLGVREDMQRIFAALDLHVLCSRSEAFANVLLEAAGAGVPSVATDVGESRFVVGDAGRIVPRHQPDALAASLRELVDLSQQARQAMGARARCRVSTEFNLQTLLAQYAELYETMARR